MSREKYALSIIDIESGERIFEVVENTINKAVGVVNGYLKNLKKEIPAMEIDIVLESSYDELVVKNDDGRYVACLLKIDGDNIEFLPVVYETNETLLNT